MQTNQPETHAITFWSTTLQQITTPEAHKQMPGS